MHATHTIDRAPETRIPTSDDVEYHIANARRIRAAALRQAGRRAGRTLKTIQRALGARLDRWAGERSLALLSDRTLADIGVPREAIPFAVRGVDRWTVDPDQPSRHPRLGPLARSLEQWRERQARRRRLVRELEAYSDRDLEELGIFRADIPRLASAAA